MGNCSDNTESLCIAVPDLRFSLRKSYQNLLKLLKLGTTLPPCCAKATAPGMCLYVSNIKYSVVTFVKWAVSHQTVEEVTGQTAFDTSYLLFSIGIENHRSNVFRDRYKSRRSLAHNALCCCCTWGIWDTDKCCFPLSRVASRTFVPLPADQMSATNPFAHHANSCMIGFGAGLPGVFALIRAADFVPTHRGAGAMAISRWMTKSAQVYGSSTARSSPLLTQLQRLILPLAEAKQFSSAPDAEHLLVKQQNGIGSITINRPKALNAKNCGK